MWRSKVSTRDELIKELMKIVKSGAPSEHVLITLRELLHDEKMALEIRKLNNLIDDVSLIKMRLNIKTTQIGDL